MMGVCTKIYPVAGICTAIAAYFASPKFLPDDEWLAAIGMPLLPAGKTHVVIEP
jgi:hypothetical protein